MPHWVGRCIFFFFSQRVARDPSTHQIFWVYIKWYLSSRKARWSSSCAFPSAVFIYSLTKTLSSCRISSSTASRPCWLFMSPEEGSWMEGSWWQWNLYIFISSSSHISRQSITEKHPPAPWLTFKKWWVMSGFLCFMSSSSFLALYFQCCNFSLSVICCLLLPFFHLFFPLTHSPLPPLGVFRVLLIQNCFSKQKSK